MSTQVVPLFTREELEARVGRIALARVLDDNNTGSADDGAVDRIIDDASGTVWAYLPNDAQTTIIATDVPSFLKKLALDVAQAQLAIRHPEFVKIDGEVMMREAKKDLTQYVLQFTKVKEVTREDQYAAVASGRCDPGWVR